MKKGTLIASIALSSTVLLLLLRSYSRWDTLAYFRGSGNRVAMESEAGAIYLSSYTDVAPSFTNRLWYSSRQFPRLWEADYGVKGRRWVPVRFFSIPLAGAQTVGPAVYLVVSDWAIALLAAGPLLLQLAIATRERLTWRSRICG